MDALRPLVLARGLLEGLLDEDGRPLGEHAVLRAPDEQVRCPYEGSRMSAGRPMNQAALRQTAARFSEITALLGAAHDLDPTAPPLVAAEACFALPLLCTRGDVVPGAASVAYKAAKGLRPVLRELFLERALVADAAELTPVRVLEAAELSGALVGTTEACAAPPALLLEAIEALLHGGRGPCPLDFDRSLWLRLASGAARLEMTRTVASAMRWWLRPLGRTLGPASGKSLPVVGRSADDRLRALPDSERVAAVSRLRPLVGGALVSAVLAADLEEADRALHHAAQDAEDTMRTARCLEPLVLAADVVPALLNARATPSPAPRASSSASGQTGSS